MNGALHAALVFSWVWIVLGFVSGLFMGLNFHREDWLGGYGSFKRRLYRLAHISFFGLGTVNLMFYVTIKTAMPGAAIAPLAACAFICGGLGMPLCCIMVAHRPQWRMWFSLPVVSLLIGGVCMILALVKL